MRKILLGLAILSMSQGAFALKIMAPEEELIKFAGEVELKSVSSRTAPRSKWENIQKMHQDEVFKDGLASASPYCLNFKDDITLEENTMIKMDCTIYDPKIVKEISGDLILK